MGKCCYEIKTGHRQRGGNIESVGVSGNRSDISPVVLKQFRMKFVDDVEKFGIRAFDLAESQRPTC